VAASTLGAGAAVQAPKAQPECPGISIGKPGEGDSDEDIVVRIKADAPVLRPDEPVPVNLVL
jgi:hypothetical protein